MIQNPDPITATVESHRESRFILPVIANADAKPFYRYKKYRFENPQEFGDWLCIQRRKRKS